MGTKWERWPLSDGSLMVTSSPQPTLSKTPQNIPEASNSLLLPT